MEIDIKICKKCNIKKDINDFQFRNDIKKFRNECKKCRAEYHKEYMINYSKLEHVKKYSNDYRKKEKYKKKKNESRKFRYYNDPLYKLICNIRNNINDKINRNNIKKDSSIEKILGCQFEQFKKHIENQFESWMTWENHGKYNGKLNFGWDLDHIIPNNTGSRYEDIVKLNHYTNFQPLDSYINRSIKKNKLCQ